MEDISPSHSMQHMEELAALSKQREAEDGDYAHQEEAEQRDEEVERQEEGEKVATDGRDDRDEEVHNDGRPHHHHHRHPFHHRHHHHKYKPPEEDGDDEQEEEDEDEDEELSKSPMFNGHDKGEDEEEDEEEEEEEEADKVYPVPHPRPHHQGLTPLLGRRPAGQDGSGSDQGGSSSGGGGVGGTSSSSHHQLEEAADQQQYGAAASQHDDDQYTKGEGQEEGGDQEQEGMEETASAASSARKQSTADSLATTATVFRSGADRAPARATTMRSLSLLYALLLVALGAVFPLAFFLSGRIREAGMCFAALHLYVTLMSILFVIYLNIAIWRHKRRERILAGETSTHDDDDDDPHQGEAQTEGGKPELEENGYLPPSPAPRKCAPGSSPGGTLMSGASAVSPARDEKGRTLEAGYGVFRIPLVAHTDDGVNWFLRLGLIAFGMGSMVLDSFRLVQFADNQVSVQCIGLLFLIFTGLRLLFTFAQTFFLFKNHRVLINFSPLLVRLSLLHLAATNIVTWAMTIIMEGANNYVNYRHRSGDNSKPSLPQYKYYDLVNGTTERTNFTLMNSTSTSEPILSDSNVTDASNPTESPTLQWLYEDMPPLECYLKRSLAMEASPFLFPCVVEYSLLAVAILCRMYTNVGRAVPLSDEVIEIKETSTDGTGKPKGTLECHKANSGLFIGLFLFTLVCIGMLFFLLFQNDVNPITEPLTALVYYGSDIGVNIFSLIAIAPAFAQMRKLHFSVFVREVFNENLMYVSVTGFFAMVAFMVIPALMSICAGGMLALLSELQAISCILSLIQACAQVVFIFDGLRRRAATRTHFRSKPGRSLITFLLLCNVSMWVIDTFELKEAMTAELFMNFYGEFPWMLLVHVVLPLTIFFRFHSTVCLSDMWVNAYHRPRMAPARPLSPDRSTPYY